jgi:preprotein translocase subunit SecD
MNRRSWAASAALVVVLVAVVSIPATAAGRAPARVEFRPVLAPLPSAANVPPASAPVDPAAARAAIASCDVATVVALAVIPTTRSGAAASRACVVFPERPGGRAAPRFYLGPVGVTPRAIKHAQAQFVSGQGWTVRLVLTKAGAGAWDALARQQFHQQVAITLDGQVVSAPTIQPADQEFTSFGGTAVVSGNLTPRQATALAVAANAGRR